MRRRASAAAARKRHVFDPYGAAHAPCRIALSPAPDRSCTHGSSGAGVGADGPAPCALRAARKGMLYTTSWHVQRARRLVVRRGGVVCHVTRPFEPHLRRDPVLRMACRRRADSADHAKERALQGLRAPTRKMTSFCASLAICQTFVRLGDICRWCRWRRWWLWCGVWRCGCDAH